jgi:hypothetical protein
MSERTSILSPAALWRRLGLARHNWPGRFTVLLATILLLLVTQPIFSGHAFAQIFATATISLVLLSAVYAFRTTKTYFTIALILIVPALGSRFVLQFTANQTLEMAGAICSCLFLTVTVVALVSRLFTVKSVTFDIISAAICAYLLIGVAWAYAFALVELRNPGSFSIALFQKSAGGGSPLLPSLHNFTYYSFVCLTTTGFGDITPVSEGARSLSVMEAVFGQLYMAILVARLVGLEIAQSMKEER